MTLFSKPKPNELVFQRAYRWSSQPHAGALSNRRGGTEPLTDFDITKNRSWRPFQLAFILLSIPALADPSHKDRTSNVDADADLLWFPTGGGKTEAYLGVAAFAMAIRRLQGDLGGFDSSRGHT